MKGNGLNRGTKGPIALASWIVLIFVLSSIPTLSTDYPKLPGWIDKLAHFVEYLVLALLFHRVLSMNRERRIAGLSLAALFLCITIAVLDEFYQRFIPGRQSSVYDLYADLSGIVVGTIAALLYIRLRMKRTDTA
jgi:VanZ family protein